MSFVIPLTLSEIAFFVDLSDHAHKGVAPINLILTLFFAKLIIFFFTRHLKSFIKSIYLL